MKVSINEELCVGCGLCVDTCPDVFEMEEDKAVVKEEEVPSGAEDTCRQAKEDCPVEAIIIEGGEEKI